MANLFLDKAGAEGVVSLVNQQIEALMEAAKQIDSDIMQQMPTTGRALPMTRPRAPIWRIIGNF